MAKLMENVNQRTDLVGANRMELLLFRVNGKQLYGINVFKVREVLHCPKLSILPGSHDTVCGVAHVRTGTIPILDMSVATGNAAIDPNSKNVVIITEYSGRMQGFLVSAIDRIVNMNWNEVSKPPKGTGKEHYLTAVGQLENEMVEIIDVERILSEVTPVNEEIKEGKLSQDLLAFAKTQSILVVDDSRIARKQVVRCLETIGVSVVSRENGQEAWEHLCEIVEQGENPKDKYSMLITDIEMPVMDGYTLVSQIRASKEMKGLVVAMHSSLSGEFNKAMVEKLGVDHFLAKFDADLLADLLIEHISHAQEA